MEWVVDIFARLPDGSPIWLESIEGLQNARARVRKLNSVAPRDYFIYFEHNGIIDREDHSSVP
jgi:hypothetical protein